ncbi:hypothetical protein CJD36_003190 [Flavipsychrobacter stenotrophus]|uniref:Phosphoribosylpyrophosphate synthetase n=1 Tax=Flavipsychrobacter stenotrophus TaxID=2077091 RepID=A0A2S7T1G5_9BACT|nr:hypothetical protein [Flavipsychrobacter stenotrophus]PQJ12768.1 hypothetical protein CJD36_003190 [Flavipsychrobacter stenotrophus]
MEKQVHYGPVAEALEEFKKQGFTNSFSFRDEGIGHTGGVYMPEELKIVDVYRYEGDSDPDEESAVYALISREGKKGVLVTGYGVSSETSYQQLLERIEWAEK